MPITNISQTLKNVKKLEYDGILTIATGKSRKATNWKNEQVSWSELVDKLQNTKRTSETFNAYKNAKKSKKDDIKDVGGFIGGELRKNRRLAANMVNRQLLTLDIDFAENVKDITKRLDHTYILHSTHSHEPSKPKLRLIIPLNRPVNSEEYEAIGRYIAGDIGIELFDDTTFQASRLMFWPSTAKDGEYVFKVKNTSWLDADKVLDNYEDWQNSTLWPVSNRVDTVIRQKISNQADPTNKQNILGVFCRSYSIQDAIKTFLPNTYTLCAGFENRYTYTKGSTTAGLVVYEDKFTFSHHGTDPTSGRLCNAFDLVRIHLFGSKDKKTKEGTKDTQLPSFKAMLNLIANDGKVKQQLGYEKLTTAAKEFNLEIPATEDTAWFAFLEVDSKGLYKSSINNVLVILRHDPLLKNKFIHNSFSNRTFVKNNLPWRKVEGIGDMKEVDGAGLRHYLETVYGITGRNNIFDGLSICIEENAFHPIRNYLNSLVWDGDKRVDTLLIDYLGAENSDYTRSVTRKTLTAAVKRIYEPGCKFDHVLTLIGKQGIGKSTLLKRIGKNWFSDNFTTVMGKEAIEQIQGYWIIEMAELAGLKKAEIEPIKSFITRQKDYMRPAYGRITENFKRQCVFIATTNEETFLNADDGNRRFWPIQAYVTDPKKNIFKGLTPNTVDMLWAEAVTLYRNKEPLYLPVEKENKAREIQSWHSKSDARKGSVEEFLEILLPKNWYDLSISERTMYIRQRDLLSEKGVFKRKHVCVAEIWQELFNGQIKDLNRFKSDEITKILNSLENWTKKKNVKRIKGYGVQRVYVNQKRKNKHLINRE